MTTQQTRPAGLWAGSESAVGSPPMIPPRLVVDGSRPAVEWVASLPASWTTQRERLVLFVLACDAFDNVSSPGGGPLASWCGLINGRLYEALGSLTRPTEVRPALLQRVDREGVPIADGKRYGGRARTGYRLCTEVTPTLPAHRDSGNLSRLDGREDAAYSPGKLSPLTLPGNSPAEPGDSLPFPSLPLSSPQVRTESATPDADDDDPSEKRRTLADWRKLAAEAKAVSDGE